MFEEDKLTNATTHLKECAEEFLLPFLEKLSTNQKVLAWPYFNAKAATLQLFNVLNCIFYKLHDIVKQRTLDEDEDYAAMIQECERDIFWSNCLSSTIWSFGALLPKELRTTFEEVFTPFKRRFNLGMSSSATAQSAGARNRFTLFDIYYDAENLQWELLQENIDYKLKLQYEPLSNQLLIPTVEVSQCFFLMDILLDVGNRYENNVLDNKHFRVVGPSGSGKSFAVNSFLKKVHGDSKFQLVQVPMSAFVTIERIKETIEVMYTCKRRNLMEPKDKERSIVLIIDDVHLQANLKVNILEFLRTWCMSKGYYDIKQGFFKGVGQFTTVTAENSEYLRSEQTKFPGREPHNSRFLFYTNTLYMDEYDVSGTDRYKVFAQQWLTSKVWTTSKLLNKYYILIANTVIAFIEKLRRDENFHNSSMLRLTSFHFFQKFCQNLVTYTLSTDDKFDVPKGQKEEDIVANMMMYELMRMYGDRIHKGSIRTLMLQKLVECFKQEFIGGSQITVQQIDSVVLGNYHDKLPTASAKHTQVSNITVVRDVIRAKIKQSSNNQFLEVFLEAPTSVKDIFRISRILFKEMQHLFLLGHAGGGKLEYLQLAAILNQALIFEINCTRLGDSLKFISYFKQSVLSVVGMNKKTFLLISEAQLRDPIYLDFIHNFMQNMCNKYELTVLWSDKAFREALIEIEKKLYQESTIKRAIHPTDDQFLTQAMRKMQKNLHIVFMIDDFKTYFEWVSLFPALEYLSEVIYMDELSTEGYKQLTQGFFQQRGANNAIFSEQKLMSALVELRQIVKNHIVNTFYSQAMLKNTCTDEFMVNSVTEFILSSNSKLNGYLFSDGCFQLNDPYHRQYNYNLPLAITSLYRSRYVMFLELFRYLYDFIALGLVVRKNYYEAFLRKAGEFTEFFKDIKKTKHSLHGQSSSLTFKVAAMRDKVTKQKQLLGERQVTVAKKEIELKELQLELSVVQDEVNDAMDERDEAIDVILGHFEKITGTEYIYVINYAHRFNEKEKHTLNTVALIIEKSSKVETFQSSEHNMYFSDRDELIGVLDDRRKFSFDEGCFTRIKDYINLYTLTDFKDKPLFKLLYTYFTELYKKLNLRNQMANQYGRIKQFNEQINNVQFSLNYSKNYIKDKSNDLQEMLDNYKLASGEERDLSMKIEDAEISHMRTDHIIEQIEKYCSKILGKLNKTKKRVESLLGDCLIMASSVTFLGAFSMKERKLIRKEMAEYLNVTTGGFIKCGNQWTEKSGANNSKIFRSVLKEYGIGGNSAETRILSSQPDGIISQETLIESIFTLMFAPSCPYVIDPTGQLQDFISNELLGQVQIKKIYASDQGVSSQLENIMRSANFSLLNDLNDCSSQGYGLCQDESLLPRLAHITYNGFEFDPLLVQSPGLQRTLQCIHTTHSSVNKRISVTGGSEFSFSSQQNDTYSLYQVQIFSPRFDFTLNSDYMARATTIVAIDDDECQLYQMGANSAWIDIKEIMLSHFLPEECQKLRDVRNRIKRLEGRRIEINKGFENAFLMATQETLQNLSEYSLFKQSVEDIKYYEDEKKLLNERYQNILQDHPLLSSYANVIFAMFQSLKKLSKVSGEVTCSWKIFTSVIDQIFSKTVRELTNKVQLGQKDKNQQSNSSIIIDSQGRLAVRSTNEIQQSSTIDFTLDEDFFSTEVIPSIFGTIQASVKYQLHSLFNLILAVKLGFKKKEMTEGEVDYFFKQLFLLKNFEDWRAVENDMVKMEDRVEKVKFQTFKRDLIKLYPEHGRKIIEVIEKEITQSFTYKQANTVLNFKIFNQPSQFGKLKLFEQINIGFICPDHEFKTKLIQLVYEQLSSVFHFTEAPIKFHEFIKLASWQQPIALIPLSNLNTINSVCSVASHYGMSLEIIRSSELPQMEGDTTQERLNENKELKDQIQSQLIDFTHGAKLETFIKDAATYMRDPYQDLKQQDKVLLSAFIPKVNVENLYQKEALREHEKAIMGGYKSKDPLEQIEQCALKGTWVFISTLRFPSYWHKISSLLDRLGKEDKIKNTFRMFFDLQGYSQSEIPDSFLFDHSISFHLTDKNSNEQPEDLQDIWSSTLNPQVLSQLTEYKPRFPEDLKNLMNQAILNKLSGQSSSNRSKIQEIIVETQDNLLSSQQRYIKDDKQRELYGQYMQHSQQMAESQTKPFSDQMMEEDAYLELVKKQQDESVKPSSMQNILNQRRNTRSSDTKLGSRQSTVQKVLTEVIPEEAPVKSQFQSDVPIQVAVNQDLKEEQILEPNESSEGQNSDKEEETTK